MFHIGESASKGRGLYASRLIGRGEVIERAPVLVLSEKDEFFVNRSVLFNYTFAWGRDGRESAIVLGCSSLINHSYEPNAVYETFWDERLFVCSALRDIEAGEEILVNYNRDPSDRSPLWFAPVEEAQGALPTGAMAS